MQAIRSEKRLTRRQDENRCHMSILGSDKKEKNAKMEYYGMLFRAANILKIALYETCNVSYKNNYWPCLTDVSFLAFFNLEQLLKNPSSQFNISWALLYLLSKVKSEKIFLASVWFIYVIIWSWFLQNTCRNHTIHNMRSMKAKLGNIVSYSFS